jgi:hypothetical protein
MSRAGASATTTSYRTLSQLAEGIVFIYVGMDALDPGKWEVRENRVGKMGSGTYYISKSQTVNYSANCSTLHLISSFCFILSQSANPAETIPLCFMLLVLLVVSRALGVIPMALLHNLWGTPRLSNSDLFIIW